jgi:hypothetical protein
MGKVCQPVAYAWMNHLYAGDKGVEEQPSARGSAVAVPLRPMALSTLPATCRRDAGYQRDQR